MGGGFDVFGGSDIMLERVKLGGFGFVLFIGGGRRDTTGQVCGVVCGCLGEKVEYVWGHFGLRVLIHFSFSAHWLFI